MSEELIIPDDHIVSRHCNYKNYHYEGPYSGIKDTNWVIGDLLKDKTEGYNYVYTEDGWSKIIYDMIAYRLDEIEKRLDILEGAET